MWSAASGAVKGRVQLVPAVSPFRREQRHHRAVVAGQFREAPHVVLGAGILPVL
jgi:hypothetical protein